MVPDVFDKNLELSHQQQKHRTTESVFCRGVVSRSRGERKTDFFPHPERFVLQEGTEYVRTILNHLSMFMCPEKARSLHLQPVAQSQQTVRNEIG